MKISIYKLNVLKISKFRGPFLLQSLSKFRFNPMENLFLQKIRVFFPLLKQLLPIIQLMVLQLAHQALNFRCTTSSLNRLRLQFRILLKSLKK